MAYSYSLKSSGTHRDLHSFPTRRSSDLSGEAGAKADRRAARQAQLRHRGRAEAGAGATDLRAHLRIVALAGDRKSTRLNSSHTVISYAVFCLKKKTSFANHPCSVTHAIA